MVVLQGAQKRSFAFRGVKVREWLIQRDEERRGDDMR